MISPQLPTTELRRDIEKLTTHPGGVMLVAVDQSEGARTAITHAVAIYTGINVQLARMQTEGFES